MLQFAEGYQIIADNEGEDIFIHLVCEPLNLTLSNCTVLLDYLHNDSHINMSINQTVLINNTVVYNETYYVTFNYTTTIIENHTYEKESDQDIQYRLEHEYRMKALEYGETDTNQSVDLTDYYNKAEIDQRFSDVVSRMNPSPQIEIPKENDKKYDYWILAGIALLIAFLLIKKYGGFGNAKKRMHSFSHRSRAGAENQHPMERKNPSPSAQPQQDSQVSEQGRIHRLRDGNNEQGQ